MAFFGTIDTRWLDDGRTMRLLDDFHFVDSQGIWWSALTESLIDGSSIPRLLWRIEGSPFVGLHRKASVIHDVYCLRRSHFVGGRIIPHEQVHHVYWEMLLEAGVGKVEAYKKWWAVAHFGPQWDAEGEDLVLEPEPEDDRWWEEVIVT